MEEKWRWLAYWRNYQFTCTLTLKHLYLLCADTSCSVKVSSAQFALPLTPLFLLYLVLGDTSGIAVMCAKGLHLPIFSSVCVTSFVCCVSRGAVDLKGLLNCNIRLIKQRNIVCKATFLHELSWIKLFRTDQGHWSCFSSKTWSLLISSWYFYVVQHLHWVELEVCNPLQYICKEECQGLGKA